jgi:uncharacterized protein (UPF0335 family)
MAKPVTEELRNNPLNPRAVEGDNSKLADMADAAAQREHAVNRLRSVVERIERLEEERKALAGDVRDIYAEAKSAGFNTKVLRQLLKIRKREASEVEEEEIELDTYRRALGM